MIIYLDIMMIYDFIINSFMLIFIEKIFKEKVSYGKVVLGSIISVVILVLSIYNYYLLELAKIIGGLIICLLAFRRSHYTHSIMKISLFYTLNLAFVGLLQSFRITKWYQIIIGIIVISFFIIWENNKKYVIFMKRNKYNVIVKINEKIIRLKGFLDTGNLSSYAGIPIIYINQKFRETNTNKVLVEVETVTGKKTLEGFVPDIFIIDINKIKRRKKVIIVFCELKEECLLNQLLMI